MSEIPADVLEAARKVVSDQWDLGYGRDQQTLTDLIARAVLAERERAIAAERERIASEADELAKACINRCARAFDAGDQGSAIIERMQGEAFQEVASAIRGEE